jgi:hypothetical protein
LTLVGLADQGVRRPVLAVGLPGADPGHHLVDQVDARRRDQRRQSGYRGAPVGLALGDGDRLDAMRVCSCVIA